MNKPINGDGWAFSPTTADKPAIWAGQDSIVNPAFSAGQSSKGYGGCAAFFFLGAWVLSLLGVMGSNDGLNSVFGTLFLMIGIVCLGMVWIGFLMGKQWLGSAWQLVASGDDLTYRGGDSWSVSVDEIARVESGQTVEWDHVRNYGQLAHKQGSWLQKLDAKKPKPLAIPDAEMQVFLFTSDGRRLVVHTANAAREDCGRLAHSIRSYVETQRGNAAPSPSSSDPSSPHNVPDGFDL